MPDTVALAALVLLAVVPLACVWIWFNLRSRRITRLWTSALQPDVSALERLEQQFVEMSPSASPEKSEALTQAAAEGAVLTGLAVPVAAVWQLAQIDPNVREAVSFASARVGGESSTGSDYGDFLAWVHQQGSGIEDVGLQNRLQGYIGEQDATAILQQANYDVIAAEMPNQPLWDLVVNGEQVDVKTVQDISSVVESARANPDITYFVNEDVAGASDLANITVLEGLNREEIRARMSDSLEASSNLTDGLVFLDAGAAAVPITFIGYTLMREVLNYRSGAKSGEAAAVDAVLALATQGPGMWMGSWAGILAGFEVGNAVDGMTGGATLGLASAAGAIAGGVTGGALGSAAGQKALNEIRFGPYLRSQEQLQAALDSYGAQCQANGAVQRVFDAIDGPSRRAHEALAALDGEAERSRRAWRWRLWPTKEQILVMAAAEYGRQQVDDIDDQKRSARQQLRRLTIGPHGNLAVGLLFANESALRDRYGAELPELDDVRIAFLRTRRIRASLEHPVTKSEQMQALKRMMRRAAKPPPDERGR